MDMEHSHTKMETFTKEIGKLMLDMDKVNTIVLKPAKQEWPLGQMILNKMHQVAFQSLRLLGKRWDVTIRSTGTSSLDIELIGKESVRMLMTFHLRTSEAIKEVPCMQEILNQDTAMLKTNNLLKELKEYLTPGTCLKWVTSTWTVAIWAINKYQAQAVQEEIWECPTLTKLKINTMGIISTRMITLVSTIRWIINDVMISNDESKSTNHLGVFK